MGWFQLHRQILDSQVFKNEGLLKVWIWCLCRANFKDSWATISTGRGTTEVEVKRGQFIFGRKTAAKKLGMPESTVWKRMQKLKNMGNLNMQSNSHYTLISIINYGSYQASETERDSERNRQGTGKEQARNTGKKKKKEKKLKALKPGAAEPDFDSESSTLSEAEKAEHKKKRQALINQALPGARSGRL